MSKLAKLLFIIFALCCHVNLISAVFYVSFGVVPSSVYTGSTITITWVLTGVQTLRVQLRILNVQTSAVTTIDSNVDLTKLSESWVVSVPAGTYQFYFTDTLNDIVTSDSFSVYSDSSHSTIPINSPTQDTVPTSSSTASSSNSNNSKDDNRNTIIGAVIGGIAIVMALVIVAVLVQKYKGKKVREESGGGNVGAGGNPVYVNNQGYTDNHIGNQGYTGNQGYMGNQGYANNQGFSEGHENVGDYEKNVGVGGYEVNGGEGIKDQNYPVYPPPNYNIN